VSAPFGPLTDAQWRHLTEHAVSAVDGGVAMVYDPGIAEAFRKTPLAADVDLWGMYDAISCPTLVIRGAESDLLLHETAQEMSRRGPKASLVEFEGIGHAPMLLDGRQIEAVSQFLLADSGS
jgi:pimeloyl-ACP methyl ester carboxylesterase